MPNYSSDSILKYLNFVYLRLKDMYDISDDESEDTYKYYKEYCKENDLEMMGFHIFYRELKKIGIATTQYRYPDGRRVRRRIFKLIELEKIFGEGRETPKQDTQSVMMNIGDKWFNVMIRVQEVANSENIIKTVVDTVNDSSSASKTSTAKKVINN